MYLIEDMEENIEYFNFGEIVKLDYEDFIEEFEGESFEFDAFICEKDYKRN